MKGRSRSTIMTVLVAGVAMVACTGAPSPPAPTATPAPRSVAPAVTGDVAAGKQLVVSKGCSACHIVPGVPEAKGTVGPSLAGLASRPTIAGAPPNNPDNMRKWLNDPSAVKPGTQMPNLGLSQKEIDDLTAFLSTLK